jgi:hypothetical protein
MPINVTCPGCMSRFTVSDKFAGKKGPCPKCKKELTIPDKSMEVVIHAPVDDVPKDSKGQSILKPIRREDKPLNKLAVIGGALFAVAVLAIALVTRFAMEAPPTPLLALGAIVVAPPLVLLGYKVLVDDELEGYTGMELLIRIGICSAIYALTWGLYVFLSWYFENKTLGDTPIIQMGIFMIIMGVIGALAALVALELEAGQAVMHYLAYFGITIILAVIMKVQLGEPFAPAESARPTRRTAPVQQAQPAPTNATAPAANGQIP